MKKIAFIAPKKGGTHNFFHWITRSLNELYWEEIKIIFIHDFYWYIQSHFKEYDIIFSIIPFFFKPLQASQYVYNLHWNYEKERKSNWIWVKLFI